MNGAPPLAGFIGLGAMGGPMALNLRKAGFALLVHDTRREAAAPHLAAGAEWADSPAEIAARCQVVFTCLPSLAVIEQVGLGPAGLIETVQPGTGWFEMSTNSRELLQQLHGAFAPLGAQVLDAPVSGGALGAVRGKLAIWVGGCKETSERFEPMLKAMGDRSLHVGELGAGLVTKLVHNCASQSIQAAIAEVFSLGVKAGAEPLALWAAIRQGSIGRRRTFDGLIDEFLPADYDTPRAALRIIEKDLQLATQLARDLRAPLRFAALALADVQEAMNRGWAERDARSVMLLPQERAGVAIKVDPERIEGVLRKDPPAPSDTKRGT